MREKSATPDQPVRRCELSLRKLTEMGYKALKEVETWILDRELNSIFPLLVQSDMSRVTGSGLQ